MSETPNISKIRNASKALKKQDLQSASAATDLTPFAGEAIRLGKDEMNLIEHPFAILWQKEPGDSVIFHEWQQVHPETGKVLRASWTVTGDSKCGLPTASDERVYLVLMELSRTEKFGSRTVAFSRYDLIKRLGWSDNDRSYGMLEGAFRRLLGVNIFAKNAFWNPRDRCYMNTGFHVLDSFNIEAEPPGRKSVDGRPVCASNFTWSELLFESFEHGYIRSIDLDFALSLNGDIALRLYRYLDKKAWDGRRRFEIDVFNLCIGHLGMKPNIYPSKLKERLKPAHEELIERGFLRAVEYEKTRWGDRKSEKVLYTFARGDALEAPPVEDEAVPVQGTLAFDVPDGEFSVSVAAQSASVAAPETEPSPVKQEVEVLVEPSVEVEAPALSPEQEELLARMEAIRVSVPIARELLLKWPASAIRCQLDCLDDRKPKNRAATFVKSVRELWALPDEYVKRIEAQEREQTRRMEQDQQDLESARLRALEREETARLEQEAVHLDAMWEKLDETTRHRIDSEISGKLGILGQMGRGETAKIAFRRTALRELLGKIEGGE